MGFLVLLTLLAISFYMFGLGPMLELLENVHPTEAFEKNFALEFKLIDIGLTDS